MTICLITSFAPVRVGSAVCLKSLPVGHFRPFHRSLAFAGNRVRPRKKGYKRRTSCRPSRDDTHIFTVPLTDVEIRQAKAGNKPTKLTDGDGLYLLVKPSGSKLWRYKYRIAGKENLFAIGEYPTINLQEARAARDHARELVRNGLHPSHARQEALSARINEGKATFRAVSDEWLEKKRKTWTERHYGEILRMLEADAYPYIGNHPMRSVTAHDVLALMRRVRRAWLPFRSDQTAPVRVQRVPVCGDHTAS
ncbi:tyrosine-type recombinase/integrase [Burkholderia sp. MSMB1826]|uniref:tyrosine-type recombinase/integrase n=1 Tax=Burkholderia sp. MSMB1826 TaxID=1637875 RepID=UPI0009E7EE51|nr:DUF4102 domain-containing protein [Burkholderia sp. MSMB1826]